MQISSGPANWSPNAAHTQFIILSLEPYCCFSNMKISYIYAPSEEHGKQIRKRILIC